MDYTSKPSIMDIKEEDVITGEEGMTEAEERFLCMVAERIVELEIQKRLLDPSSPSILDILSKPPKKEQ